jgi:hypothetical protein
MKKRKGRERKKEETGKNWHPCMFCIYLSIFVSRENKESTIEKEREKQKEGERETAERCSRRRERIITSFSLPLS